MTYHLQRSLPIPPLDSAQVEALTQINLSDLYESFKLARFGWARGLLRPLFRHPARQFAQLVAEYDARVGRDGLAEGAAWILAQLHNRLSVHHAQRIPAEGPVMVLANHPGVADTMALAAALPRRDLRYIAHRRPFLSALPNTSRQLLYVDDDPAQRMTVTRKAVRHLQAGGTIVTFPGGKIDPDPAGATGAVAALENWSSSVGLLARRAPQTTIVPTLIMGVISPSARRSPFVWPYTDPAQREWVAATVQIALPFYRDVHTRVIFGEPLHLGTADRQTIMSAVTEGMADLIHQYGAHT